MKNFKRIISLVLLILTCACFFAGCIRAPKDEVRANLLDSKFTYIEEEDKTKIFVAFDVLNGKKRSIDGFEADITFTYEDGTVKQLTIPFEGEIDYADSSLARYTFYVEGKVEHGEFTAFRFTMMNYWESYGDAIIGFCIGFLILGFIFMFFSMGEMSGALSVGAAAVVLFDIAVLIFMPFIRSIIVILASLLSFVPMVVQSMLDY